MDYTPAHEFLSDLGDINAFILDALNSPRKAQWHWPSYYLLYVDADRLVGLLVRVGDLFKPPFGQPGGQPAAERWTADANDLFAQIDRQQKAIVRWLFQMYRYTDANPADPAAHRRLGAHVHPKSGWYQTFMSDFCSGVVTADAKTLQRVVLQTDPGTIGGQIDNVTAGCMLRRQVFDLATPATREALAHATYDARCRLGKILATMTAFLAANCSIADLLHPGSR